MMSRLVGISVIPSGLQARSRLSDQWWQCHEQDITQISRLATQGGEEDGVGAAPGPPAVRRDEGEFLARLLKARMAASASLPAAHDGDVPARYWMQCRKP